MKKHLLSGILLLLITGLLYAQTQPLTSTFFTQQDKKESYQCIQIRRGDIITLTGKIEFIGEENDLDPKILYFTSLGGRTFILKGDMLPEIKTLYKTKSDNINLTGKILFEGREDIPAELEVSAFKPSKN